MPTVKDFGAFKIYMYFEDENPPHVHVVGPDFAAKMRIPDQVVFAGEVAGKIERRAAEYVAKNQLKLMALWDEYR